MMKKEFDELVGMETDPKCYERIEEVYHGCDFFQNKQQIAEFYKKYDMNGIERMYTEVVLKQRKLEKENIRVHADNLALRREVQKDAFIRKLEELMRMVNEDVVSLTRIGDFIDVKYKSGYVKSICIAADSNQAIVQDVVKRI